jgi:hypothetical protein
MPAVAVLFVIVTVLVVTVIGLVSVGGVTARLAAAPPRSLFDLDEAVEFVADRLPGHAAAQLSYDDLRLVLGWHLEYLEAKGMAADDDGGERPPGRRGDDGAMRAVVAGDDEGVAYVLGRAGAAGVEVDDVAVVEVVEIEGAYLEAIGALGHQVGTEILRKPEE